MEEKTMEKQETLSSEREPEIEKESDEKAEIENPSDAQAEFSEQYKQLPVWKQVVILVLFLGGMTAVIMLINFVVEFGSEIIKALLK